MTLYMDDSGTRQPDHTPLPTRHGYDWFGYGGIIVRDDDKPIVNAAYEDFCSRWNISYPLHSHPIRYRSKDFAWLQTLQADERERFMGELSALATLKELTVLAAVVDRPGYNDRYRLEYGRHRWSLCRTAFNIVVERAVKFARSQGCKLRVYIENSDRKTDAMVRQYYNNLRADGPQFSTANSQKYDPVPVSDLRETLYELDFKQKTSRLMQLADICLWPVCRGAYEPETRAFKALRDAGTLIDSKLSPSDVEKCGIKRSCFELHDSRATSLK